jgi:hypothetical protein
MAARTIARNRRVRARPTKSTQNNVGNSGATEKRVYLALGPEDDDAAAGELDEDSGARKSSSGGER